MPKNLRRSIFIGLGGTGIKSILKTKAILLDNYGKEGELPPMFTFLGIDTDFTEYEKSAKSKTVGEITLTAKERFSISVARPKQYYERSRMEMLWMPRQNIGCVTTLDRGAGQVRSNGRVAFMYNKAQLKTRLEQAISDVNSSNTYDARWSDYQSLAHDNATKTEVHIVFSVCGGTGSGTFLDVAYLMRDIARDTCTDITINGYAVLPGVFMDEIRNVSEKSRVQPNAYGALRELDYLMSVTSDNRLVKISWKPEETDETPFDSLVLVDNVNTQGVHYRKMSDLTEMLSLALLASTGQIGNQASSVGDNVKVDMFSGAFDVEDKRAWVSAVGTSAIVYDGANVAKVYELKAQNKLIQDLLTEVDCNNLANNWIDTVRIRENNGKDQVIDCLYDLQGITMPVLTEKDFDKHTVVADINHKLKLYNQGYQLSTEEWNAKVDALYEATKSALVEKEKELCTTSIGAVISFLQEVKRQIVACFQKEMNEELLEHNQERNEAKTDYDAMVDQLADYLKNGFFHTKTANYLAAIKGHYFAYLIADLEAKRRSSAIEFYAKMVTLIDSELTKHNAAKEKLESIKVDNDTRISELQNSTGGNDTVLINLADDFIKNVELKEDENIPVSGFVAKLPGQSLYQEATKETYQAILVEYTSNLVACATLRNMTIDDILNSMSQEKFEELIRRAANFSRPFLRIDGDGIKLKESDVPLGMQEQFYICVPNVKTSRLTVDEYYLNIIDAEVATPMSTGLNDRIIIYRQKRPVPALAIAGLESWSVKYDTMEPRISCHIDSQMHQRMDDEDYSFAPKKANQSEAIMAWTMGCILGLIKFEKSVYWYHDETIELVTGMDDKWVSTHSAYRDKAFEKFCMSDHIIKQYTDKFIAYLKAIGDLQKSDLYNDVRENYFIKYSRCQLTKKTIESVHGYEETQKLLINENKCIDYIFKL